MQIRSPGRSDDEPEQEPYYQKTQFEVKVENKTKTEHEKKNEYVQEMCEENTAKITLLEADVQELRQASELLKQKLRDEKANSEGRTRQQVKDNDREKQENMAIGPSRHKPFRRCPRPSPLMPLKKKYRVFCGGQGFTDSCRNVLSSKGRANIIRAKCLCTKCLEQHGGSRRNNVPCPYCSSNDHRRALCDTLNAFEERAKKSYHC
ncbi:hypothetical protein Y032_0007g3327 [Ancylostoma ceylanicum]|nr:hypothetical protein Y032_0007g3327 [Ancylostoma ceylanicum]